MESTGPNPDKVFDKPKKPLSGLDKTKSLRPKKKIDKGARGKHFSNLYHSDKFFSIKFVIIRF